MTILDGEVGNFLESLKFATKIPDNEISDTLVHDPRDPLLQLLQHTLKCIDIMRKIANKYQQLAPFSPPSLGVVTKLLNTLTKELGKYLVMEMSNGELDAHGVTQEIMLMPVLESILKMFPEIARKRHHVSGKNLLHVTAMKTGRALSREKLRALLQVHPEGASDADVTGAVPLHWATTNAECSAELVDVLLEAFPDAVRSVDNDGRTPLHWAVSRGDASPCVVNTLLRAYPEAAIIPCNLGNRPLHSCVDREDVSIPVLKMLLDAAPEAARTRCATGGLPIHLCARYPSPSLKAIELLTKCYPKGLLGTDKEGQIPLHKVAEQEAPNTEVLRFLVDSCAESVRMVDHEGYLPIHLVLDCQAPDLKSAGILFDAFPDCAMVATLDGLLPLHIMMSGNDHFDLEFLEKLLQAYPGSVNMRAVDFIPMVDSMGEGSSEGQGRWREIAWTPYSRALEYGWRDVAAIMTRHGGQVVAANILNSPGVVVGQDYVQARRNLSSADSHGTRNSSHSVDSGSSGSGVHHCGRRGKRFSPRHVAAFPSSNAGYISNSMTPFLEDREDVVSLNDTTTAIMPLRSIGSDLDTLASARRPGNITLPPINTARGTPIAARTSIDPRDPRPTSSSREALAHQVQNVMGSQDSYVSGKMIQSVGRSLSATFSLSSPRGIGLEYFGADGGRSSRTPPTVIDDNGSETELGSPDPHELEEGRRSRRGSATATASVNSSSSNLVGRGMEGHKLSDPKALSTLPKTQGQGQSLIQGNGKYTDAGGRRRGKDDWQLMEDIV